MAVSRMLVAVSSPWASERFAAPLVDLAQRLGAEVLIAHVAQIQQADKNEADAKARGEATLNLLIDELRETGIEADGVLIFSEDVAKAILNTAKERNCTLIVLGASGDGMLRGLFKRLFSNDVTTSVTRQATVPVLLCPTNWRGTI